MCSSEICHSVICTHPSMMADTQALPVNQRVILDRLHAWETTVDSKAPLTGAQKDTLVELTAKTSDRPFPKDVSSIFIPNFDHRGL